MMSKTLLKALQTNCGQVEKGIVRILTQGKTIYASIFIYNSILNELMKLQGKEETVLGHCASISMNSRLESRASFNHHS